MNGRTVDLEKKGVSSPEPLRWISNLLSDKRAEPLIMIITLTRTR